MTGQPEHDPLGDLAAAGVAVWLDDLSRELLAGGGVLDDQLADCAGEAQVQLFRWAARRGRARKSGRTGLARLGDEAADPLRPHPQFT
jgi:hypothetical protein